MTGRHKAPPEGSAASQVAGIGGDRIGPLMEMAIAGLADADLDTYRGAIMEVLARSEPETIRQLGRVVKLLDAEIARRVSR